MRFEIQSTDRIGISQEILSIFSSRLWDVIATEVITCFTYVYIKNTSVSITEVISSIKKIKGVVECKVINLLPSEKREQHLQALLDRIPDPIIDINEQGIVLSINKTAKALFNQVVDYSQISSVEGSPISKFIEQGHELLLADKVTSCTVICAGQTYIADVSPVFLEIEHRRNSISGAVIILRTMNTLGRQISLMQSRKEPGIDSIIGQSAKMRILIEQTLRYAELELPVLISGETGTGKELIARALHTASKRSKSPFLAINCAALSEHLLESELFGYASGAFTGAQKGGKPGLFELANGGTIFLDEIAEMSIYLQAKLLRFLQDFRFRRVGGTTELLANVRVISASHQNLPELLEKKMFREDLFYRLNVLNLELPPLRNRVEDIPLLTQWFIKNAALQVNQTVPKITEQALNTLLAYHWPGNIRQLQNILFRVVALDTKRVIEQSDLVSALSQFDKNTGISVLTNHPPIKNIDNWATAQAEFEYNLLTQLHPSYPTTRKLAQRLNVSHNKIAMKLREHGIGG